MRITTARLLIRDFEHADLHHRFEPVPGLEAKLQREWRDAKGQR